MASLKGSSKPSADEINLIKAEAVAFPSVSLSRDAFERCFDTFGDCKVLLIGDASHGTSEFYTARAEITKYMVEHHGFNIVACEADWPDAEAVDRYVRRRPWTGVGPRAASVETVAAAKESGLEPAFMRFPTWMWRNVEVHDFVEWLRGHNEGREPRDAVGFYGLDLYSMGASIEAVIGYLDRADPKLAAVARERYGLLLMWAEDPHEYGLETMLTGFKGYEKEVIDMLRDLLKKRLELSAAQWDGDEFHSAEQNARVVVDAERYYKAMYLGRDESWNLRDTHMFQTLNRILKHCGNNSKAIVWAHNSHIGNARATSMGWSSDELNIGQLCKETYGEQALSIGCGTYTGTVAAANRWGDDMRVIRINPGMQGSYEELMHATGIKNFVLDLRKGKCSEQLREALRKKRLERFIGVIYRPDTERQSHYSSAILPEQFDGFVWMDETRHVGTLEVHQPPSELGTDETWPFGL